MRHLLWLALGVWGMEGAERTSGASLTLEGPEDGWFEVTVRNSGARPAKIKLSVIGCGAEAAWSEERLLGAHEEWEARVEKGPVCEQVYDLEMERRGEMHFGVWPAKRTHVVLARLEVEDNGKRDVSLQASALRLVGDELRAVDNFTVENRLARKLAVEVNGHATVGNFGEETWLEVGSARTRVKLEGRAVTTVSASYGSVIRAVAVGGGLMALAWRGEGGWVRKYGAESRIRFEGVGR